MLTKIIMTFVALVAACVFIPAGSTREDTFVRNFVASCSVRERPGGKQKMLVEIISVHTHPEAIVISTTEVMLRLLILMFIPCTAHRDSRIPSIRG